MPEDRKEESSEGEKYEKKKNSSDDEKREDKKEEREGPSDDDKEELKLYVGNISDVTDKALNEVFSKLSDEAEFKRNKDGGFGFIQTYNKKDYEEALKLDGTDVDGVKIQVQKSKKSSYDRNDSRGGERKYDNVRDKPSVFVKNLSYDSNRSDVERFFSKCGEVVDVYLPRNRDREGHRGFCYVRFNTEKGQKNAMELHDEELGGRRLFVDLPRNNRSSGGDRRGGGYERKGGYDRRGGGHDRRGGYDRRDRRRNFYDRDERRSGGSRDYDRDDRRSDSRRSYRDDRRDY